MKEHDRPHSLDTIFAFEDELRREGRVRLRLYPLSQKRSLAIVTDLDQGPSVTNAAEAIATQVVESFGIDPERLLWVEHYAREDRRGGRSGVGEEYDWVQFTWNGERFTHPQWSPSTQAEIEAIIGEKL